MGFKGFLKPKACKYLNRNWFFSVMEYGELKQHASIVIKKTAEVTICGLLFEFVSYKTRSGVIR